jgi:ribosome-associated protein
MSRKSRKGYYVEGEFVAAGSELDQQFRTEQKGTEAPSRTELKGASEELQKLGEDLLTLREDLFAALPLPETLQDAILLAKRITNFEGKRRQKQFIGKLMHRLDAGALEAVTAALRLQHSQSAQDTLVLHRAERWRDALIADDEKLGQWIEEFPGTDAQQFRALVRQARKEALAAKAAASQHQAGGAPRQGRAYRQIFLLVRAQLSSSADNPS